MSITTHYGLTREEYAQKCGKHPSCFDANKPYPLCGNGSFHAKTTRAARLVDCPACLERMKASKTV